MKITKRTFLKSLAVSALAVPAAATRAVELKSLGPDVKWDKEADVVIIGYGGAGAAAAMEAHDKGSKVLIIEKMPNGGGNTEVSGGGIMVPDSEKDAYTYLKSTYDFADSEMDDDLLKKFCSEIVKQPEFLKTLGDDVKLVVYGYAGFPTLPCSDTIKKYRVKGKRFGGQELWALYSNGVENQRKIPILYNSPAQRLITKDGEVVGVVVKNEGKDINVKANKAVILTTGGYEYDPSMLRNFAQGTQIKALGCPGNTGDGIRMAQSAGGDLWHMTAYSCALGVPLPGKTSSYFMTMRTPDAIWVDQDGKRFVNEKGVDTHTCLYVVQYLDPEKHRYPRIPAYVIFDEKARKSGPITTGLLGCGWATNKEGFTWSKDNQKEIDAGMIIKADTLEDLAKKIGADPETLKATVQKWNTDVKAGKDTQFNRPIKKESKVKSAYLEDKTLQLSAPLDETGPYYALPTYPALINTQGGPRKGPNGEVLNPMKEPIPRLYAAGEMGSMWGSIYQGACNNAEALVFGRLAGRAAAAQEPWK